MFSVWSLLMSVGFLIAAYFSVFLKIFPREFKPNQKQYNTINALRCPNNLPVQYRSLEVLHKNALEIAAPCIIPIQVIFTNLCLFCNFTLITQWNKMNTVTKAVLLLWTCAVLVAWITGLQFGGWMRLKSIQVLRSWYFYEWSKADMKYMRRFQRSCKPLAIRVGKMYCIKRNSVLTFLRGIVRGTFRALLTLHKSKSK